MDFIFPVRALTSVTYPPCIYEGMGMHSWFAVVCQIWGQFRWNLVIYGSKCPILKGLIKRPNLQTAHRYRAESFWVDSNLIGWSTCAVTRSDLMRDSHSRTPKNWIFLKFYNIFDLHRSPVDRQPLMIWTSYFRCLLYVPSPIDPVNMKAWRCTADPQ